MWCNGWAALAGGVAGSWRGGASGVLVLAAAWWTYCCGGMAYQFSGRNMDVGGRRAAGGGMNHRRTGVWRMANGGWGHGGHGGLSGCA